MKRVLWLVAVAVVLVAAVSFLYDYWAVTVGYKAYSGGLAMRLGGCIIYASVYLPLWAVIVLLIFLISLPILAPKLLGRFA